MNLDNTNGFRPLSPKEFANLGAPIMAYVRPVTEDGQTGYGIYSADGRQMTVVANRELAFASALQHDLQPVSVH